MSDPATKRKTARWTFHITVEGDLSHDASAAEAAEILSRVIEIPNGSRVLCYRDWADMKKWATFVKVGKRMDKYNQEFDEAFYELLMFSPGSGFEWDRALNDLLSRFPIADPETKND